MNVAAYSDLAPDADGAVRVRAMFLSDVHLGTRGCQAEKLLDFLRHYDADLIYLVGDIVDGWQLKSGWYWPQHHNDVVQKLLRKARKGARIVYIPGNHDEFLREFYGTHFGGIEVVESVVHLTADGRRFLIIHGDLFDVVIRHARWLALLGDKAYDMAIALNTRFNALRRLLGLPYWSLSQWVKLKVKNAVNFIGEFEKTLSGEALRRQVDGVICGHIHHAVIRERRDLTYVNCGDWVESCTAAVENFDGRLEIIDWSKRASGHIAPPQREAPTSAPAPENPGPRIAARDATL
jgi:UDP-2,3-diacylglucosamine pyrophosphatase LpxH